MDVASAGKERGVVVPRPEELESLNKPRRHQGCARSRRLAEDTSARELAIAQAHLDRCPPTEVGPTVAAEQPGEVLIESRYRKPGVVTRATLSPRQQLGASESTRLTLGGIARGVVRCHPSDQNHARMTPDNCYRLIVAGPLSQTAAQIIDARFGPAASIGLHGSDSEVHLTADQPALRALLTLLWDLGHDLVAIHDCADSSVPSVTFSTRSATIEADSRLGPEPELSETTRRSAHHDEV